MSSTEFMNLHLPRKGKIMFDKSSVRRAMLAAVFGMLCIFAGYQYAWHKDEFSSSSALQSFGLLAVVLLFVGIILVMMFNRKSDHPAKILVAAVLGAVAAIWGKNVLSGIDTRNLFILLGVVLGFIAFVALISVKDLNFLNKLNRSADSSKDEEDVSSEPTPIHDGPSAVSAV